MKYLFVLLFIILTTSGVYSQEEKKIIILHTNDLHSRMAGYAPELAYTPATVNDDHTTGGFARIATLIKREKAAAEGRTLVIDAGDFTMGTLFPSLELTTGFELRLLKWMGYDVVGLGNHEFDFGPGWLAAVINKSVENGVIPAILAGNTVTDPDDKADDGIEELFRKNILRRSIIMEVNGLKIGLFSLLGKNAAEVSPNAAPVTFQKQSKLAAAMVRELKKENCDLIVCISHSGISKNDTQNPAGEDVELARKVKGIDVIIGGHTHTRIDKPIIVNGTVIVQTGEFGKNMGRMELAFSGGRTRIDNYRLIPVDDQIPGDRDITEKINEQKEKINSIILKPMGMDYDRPVAESTFIISGNDTGDFQNSNLGPLVADAIYSYVNNHNSLGTDVAMVAAGMLFDNIVAGIEGAPDLFRVTPLGSGDDNLPGYPLSRLYVTGKELKSILEILLVAYKSDPQNYCYYSGIKVSYSPERGLFRKISDIGIVHENGTVETVSFSRKSDKLYSITADSYMLKFIGILKKKSFGLVNVVPKNAEGLKVNDMKSAVIDIDETRDGIQEGKEWLALIEFLSSMKDVDGNGIPDIDQKYRNPVRTFFPLK